MSTLKKLIHFILKWEGGYVEDPDDSGGPTNMGVTLRTWQEAGYDKNGDGIIDSDDLKMIFIRDVVECVLRPHYCDRWKADRIADQSVANLLVDWYWTSGAAAIKNTKRMFNLKPDAVVDEETLAAINSYPDQEELFDRIKAERAAYIKKICELKPANRRYKKGWMNRFNDLRYNFFSLVGLLCLLVPCFSACKSAASAETAQVKTEIVSCSEKVSEQRTNSDSEAFLSKQTDSTEDSETVIQTITVRFDTASSDSTRGNYRVKELTKTLAIRGKAIRLSVSETSENRRIDSTFVHNRETNDRKESENLRTRKVGIPVAPFRLYAILALIFITLAVGWIIRKKITDFFYSSGEK